MTAAVAQVLLPTITILIALLGLYFRIGRDIAELRERMARVEGLLEGVALRERTPAR